MQTTRNIVPKGDPKREAVNSLRGYAYQAMAATLAWIDIGENDHLYLEVAEDYAKIAGHAIKAVQVKETKKSGSVTLNSKSVRNAVATFIDLVKRNADIQVEFRFFSTSKIGKERPATKRPAGIAGLEYWRKAATDKTLALSPLRTILESDKFPNFVKEFSKARDDKALRRDLIERIYWDCGKPDFSTLRQELEKRLVVVGRDRFLLSAEEAQQLVYPLVYRILEKSIEEKTQNRVLTRAELYKTIEETTQVQVSLPRTAVKDLLLNVSAGSVVALGKNLAPTSSLSLTQIDWFIDGTSLPAPKGIIPRVTVESAISKALGNFGAGILAGGSGLGKSIVSKRIAIVRNDAFFIVDFRNSSVEETCHRLNMIFGYIGSLPSSLLILEDLNHIEDSGVVLSLTRVVQALRRRRREVIITCYRKPSLKTLADLGLGDGCAVNCSYFSNEETRALVLEYGGDPDIWGLFAHAMGAFGHPQLTHAFVIGTATREWPTEEIKEIFDHGLSSEDINAARETARRNLVSALPQGTRNLLYRLSLTVGRFERSLALTIGNISPRVSQAGECIDQLVGPWIEPVGKNLYKVSPLASQFGYQMLSVDEQKRIHKTIAVQMIKKGTVDITDIDVIMMHATAGKSTDVLTSVVAKVLSSDHRTLEVSAEHILFFRYLQTDKPAYPEDPLVSAMLRLAQLRLAAAAGEAKRVSEIATVFLNETSEIENEPRRLLEGSAMSILLSTVGIANYIDDWISVLRRFNATVEAGDFLEDLQTDDMSDSNFLGLLFGIGSADISSVKRLESIIDQLDELDATERSLLLKPAHKMFSDYSTFINGPWIIEQDHDDFDAEDAAARYQRMAKKTKRWQIRPLSLQCSVAQAVILDEYLNNKKNALAVLEEAVSAMGPDQILSRTMAKIYWRHGEHGKVIKIIRNIEDYVGGNNLGERAFALREAAISAAKCGEWQQSEKWFRDAQSAAEVVEGGNMEVMAVALGADSAVAAFEAGHLDKALERLAEAVSALADINPEMTLRAAHCHRVIRHTVLWMKSRIDGTDVKIEGEPIKMEPGICSNPSPLPAIQEHPLGHIDISWYMLAEVETTAGLDLKIASTLEDRLAEGAIPAMEVSLRMRIIETDISRFDAVRFAAHFKSYVQTDAYFLKNRDQLLTRPNPLVPQRGKIPKLDTNASATPEVEWAAKNAILAYSLSAVFANHPGAVAELKTALENQFTGSFPGKLLFEEDQVSRNQLDQVVAKITRELLRSNHVIPEEFWLAGLRFLEWVNISRFKHILAPRLAAWQRFGWKRILTEESFRLRAPQITIPAIEEVLKIPTDDRSFVASLLLTTSQAVGTRLNSEYRDVLKAIADGPESGSP